MKSLSLFFAFSLILISAYAQTSRSEKILSLEQLTLKVNGYHKKNPAEYVFVHTDKSIYKPGDTLWLKAYVVDAALKASEFTGIVYLEMIADGGTSVTRTMMNVTEGRGDAAYILDTKIFPVGKFNLRVYTNWMRNFDERLFFSKDIYIQEESIMPIWIAKHHIKFLNVDQQNLVAEVQISDYQGRPIVGEELNFEVRNAEKHLFIGKVKTSSLGVFNVPINIQSDRDSIGLVMRATSVKHENIAVDFLIDSKQLQQANVIFAAEGGDLINGISTRLAIKAFYQDQQGAIVTGQIVRGDGLILSRFKTSPNGLSDLIFTPQTGDAYNLVINAPGQNSIKYPLPLVKASGVTLNIAARSKDSLSVDVNASEDLITADKKYFLIGYSREKICLSAKMDFKKAKVSLSVSKNIFPTGIAKFLIFDDEGQVVSERNVFVDNDDQLKLEVMPLAKVESIDSLNVKFKVTNRQDNLLKGSFSLAIVANENAYSEDISIRQLLFKESFFKNMVDTYYLSNDSSSAEAIDLLMILQDVQREGLSKKNIFNNTLAFKKEPQFNVTGKVRNLFNVLQSNISVSLISGSPLFVMKTTTNDDGMFVFEDFPQIDTPNLFLQAVNKKGKAFNLGIEVDKFVPPALPFFERKEKIIKDESVMNQTQPNRPSVRPNDGSKDLKEVVIVGKKIIKGSKNLNGSGNADQVFSETDMQNEANRSLERFLEKRIKGFAFGRLDKQGRDFDYVVDGKQVHFVIDGKFVDDDFMPKPPTITAPPPHEHYYYSKSIIDRLNLDDIVGVEVLAHRNTMYIDEFGARNALYRNGLSSRIDYKLPGKHAYVEITTKSGLGPVFSGIGSFRYTGMAFSNSVKFKSPTIASGIIHWEPNLETDVNGNASVTIPRNVLPPNFIIQLQGLNFDGSLGVVEQKLIIDSEKK